MELNSQHLNMLLNSLLLFFPLSFYFETFTASKFAFWTSYIKHVRVDEREAFIQNVPFRDSAL